ncbi:fungal-specific transcription factor domain-containing protein, partial [Podospora didyma]
CNGVKPCTTCTRRKLTCTYTSNNNADHGLSESGGSPTKRRHIDTSPQSIHALLDGFEASPPQHGNHGQSQLWEDEDDEGLNNRSIKAGSSTSTPTALLLPSLSGHEVDRKTSNASSQNPRARNTANGQSEETTIYTETRMLQDQTGRLLYIGDASTLSILQLIRIIVENTAGADLGSPFIDDPKRHRIMENIIDFPEDTRVPSFLPDKETTDILVQSYFTNTCGILEVFDKRMFLDDIEACYNDPLSATNYFLCHLFLVLALGLLLAAPIPGGREEVVIQKQLSAKLDRAELFFRSARSMSDPGAGFEDADFWSIQALSLMTVYMLSVSKRNTAYAYLGMAVRSAYALGLHREETMNDFIFTPAEMKIRRNMWKTLFILDRFLAASLGRPTAIAEDDCSCDLYSFNSTNNHHSTSNSTLESVHLKSLDACVRSCHVIGVTLKVFSQRKISTAKVQEIADRSKDWHRGPRANLHGLRPTEALVDSAQGIASLHDNLLSLHSLILLTRQLFVMHNWKLQEQRSGMAKEIPMHQSPMAKYSEACVVASYQTIQLVQKAKDEKYLPRRNPFVIYFLFVASLIVFMNQFASLYYTSAYAQTISDALALMEYCAETDPQAKRVLEIMHKFATVVAKWTQDHTYRAPPLAADLNNLYSQTSSPQTTQGRTGSVSSVLSPREHSGVVNIPHQRVRLPLSDILISHPTAPLVDTRMNGITPPQTTAPGLPQPTSSRHSLSSHSVIEGSDSLNGDIEVDFDGLWANWINHVAPVSAVPPGITNLAPHFPASILGPPGEAYGGYPIPPTTTLGSNVPVYHSSNFG